MVIVLALLVLVFTVVSCSRGDAGRFVTLPPTPVVTLRPTWAVVTDSYLRLHAEPRSGAPIIGHLRRADVAEILEIGTTVARVDGEQRLWYRLAADGVSGWALDLSLDSYGSEYRARNAGARLAGRRE